MGMITDNFKYRDNWGTSRKYQIYKGPWQGYLRDIDPIFTTRKSEIDFQKSDYSSFQGELGWWMDIDYDYWNLPNKDWVNMEKDLPDPKQMIVRKNEDETEWLCLGAYYRWMQPNKLGQDKYRSSSKQVWYPIQSYLVKRADKNKVVRWLKAQNFWNNGLPQKYDSFTGVFSRELYWSPIAKSKSKETWSTVGEKNYRLKVTTSCAVGEMSGDKSGAHFYYDMPCKQLFDGLDLTFGSKDGELINKTGEIIVNNPEPSVILIRKKELMQYLEKNDMELIWVLVGEKIAMGDGFHGRGNNYFKVINGVYTLENEKLNGSFRLDDRE